jgi:citrate lyase alpha subunit
MKGNQKDAAPDGAALEIIHHDVIGGDAVVYLVLESCAQGGFWQLPILSGIQRSFLKRI